MYQIKVNGKMYKSEKDMVLLDFLRDELHLTGTKDGCGEGVCGACTVIVDGRKTKSCVGRLSKYEGQAVVTIEGLSQREKDVYVYAFGEAGAVQCGFCIPGMVISAKSLLDENLNPTSDEVKAAIHGNICRCTGYVKIEEAIMLAARLFREDLPIPEKIEAAGIGKRVHRVDTKEKVLGTGQYVDDVVIEGMIYAKALRTKYPRARVDKIDSTKAQAHPDCVEVLRAEDVPYNKTGHIVPDWDVLIPQGSITRYIGDALALVATRHKETLDEVLSLIEVEYTELEPMLSPAEALKPDAPKIHEKGNILDVEEVNRGNVDEAIANSKYVVTRHYSTPQTDHAFMEPECAIAIPEGDDHYMLLTGSQGIYDEQHEVSRMLKLPAENIRSQSKLVGGGFGGKEDMSVQHHAALMAWKTGQPVKVQFSRQESLNIHVKRHAMAMDITTACDEDGNLTASKVVIISDCGAYASLGGPVLQRACTHSGGPYHYDNFAVKGTCVYTNNVPGGAFRGFGVTQSAFAQEVNIDLLAEMAGLDPWAFRYKNAIRSGESLPNGQIAGAETAMVECLEAVKDAYYSSPRTGLGICLKNSGIGVGLPDIGRMKLAVIDGVVHIRTSAACIGQGIGTVVLQILCETTGLKYDQVFVEAPDTLLTPDSGTTTASRQTLFTGEATRLAGLKLNEALKGHSLEELNGQEFYAEYFGQTDPMGSDKPHPVSHIAYGYAAGVAEIGDDMKISKFTAAYDVGQIINPQACEGQGEGGILMGMGFAVTEDFIMDKGYVKSKYGTLGLLRAEQRPELHVKLVEKANKQGLAYGAKGVGEISSIPAAPAIANAYRRIDGEERLSLPIQHTAYKK